MWKRIKRWGQRPATTGDTIMVVMLTGWFFLIAALVAVAMLA